MKLEFTKNKIIALSGAVVAIIGLFLPFLKATVSVYGYKASATVKFIEGSDGKLFLVALIAAVVLLVIKKLGKVCYSLAGLCLLATIYDGFINTGSEEFDAMRAYGAKVAITRGIGFWIVLIGIIAFAIGAFLEFQSKKEKVQEVPQQPVQPTYSAPVEPQQPVQPTYSAPVEPQQPVQPTYSAPVEPQQPIQPTYSAPVEPQQPSDFNQNNSNNTL